MITKDWTYHKDKTADKELEKDFKRLAQRYYNRTGIIIEEISAFGIGLHKEKVHYEDIIYSGGDKRNLN